MKYLLICCFILFTGFSYACLNERHVNKSGKETIDAFHLSQSGYQKSHNKAELELYLKNLYADKKEMKEDIFDQKNNIAVTLIKLGRLEEAEKILLDLKKEAPDDYYVIVNLGTLYELQGENKEALQYIKKALLIDPESHGGSEWFHVKVLEFKLKNIPESEIPNQHILNIAQITAKGRDIAAEIDYQLKERIPFTPAPNLMMAKILQEFADYLADSVSIKAAYLFYEMGKDYDRQNVLQLDKKKEGLTPYFKKYKEAVPVLNNYYVDGIIQTVDDNKVNIVSSLLEKGLGYLKEKDEEEKRRQKQKQLFLAGGIFVLLAGVVFFILRKRSHSKKGPTV